MFCFVLFCLGGGQKQMEVKDQGLAQGHIVTWTRPQSPQFNSLILLVLLLRIKMVLLDSRLCLDKMFESLIINRIVCLFCVKSVKHGNNIFWGEYFLGNNRSTTWIL